MHGGAEDLFLWQDLEASAPELARLASERLARFGFVLIGTLRKDGAPRINPCEAYIVDGNLVMNMMRGSLKAFDLLRDPRVFLHSPITRKEGDEGEFKLSGRVLPIETDSLKKAVSDTIEAVWNWRPAADSHFFAVDIQAVAFVQWQDGRKATRRWSRERGEF